MDELENGNTKTDDEKQTIESKNTPYGISEMRNDFPELENEDVNEEILVTEAVATSYSEEEENDTTTEVVVEKEMEPDLVETNEISVFPVSETEETLLLDTSNGNIDASSDSGKDRNFVFGENIPRLEDSKNVEQVYNMIIDTENQEIDQNVEDDHNTVVYTENRQIDQYSNSRSKNSKNVEEDDHNMVINREVCEIDQYSNPRMENSKNVEEDYNTVIDTENREIDQHPISANPSLAQRTSWGGCCGLFEYLRCSRD